jgi:hypothetical protein
VPLGGKTVFGIPHRALLRESSANTESQPIHATQLLLGSALRDSSLHFWELEAPLRSPKIVCGLAIGLNGPWWLGSGALAGPIAMRFKPALYRFGIGLPLRAICRTY